MGSYGRSPDTRLVAGLSIDAEYLTSHLVRVARGAAGELLGPYTMIVPALGGEGEGELDFMAINDAAQGRGVGRVPVGDARAGFAGAARGLTSAAGFYRSVEARRVALVPSRARSPGPGRIWCSDCRWAVSAYGVDMHISRLQFVSVPAADHVKACEFYVDVLGFELVVDFAGPHGQFVMVAPPGAQTGVVLVDFSIDGRGVGGPVHLQFHTDDLDGDIAELRAAGVAAGNPQEAPWGRMTSFTDLDGNPISLLQPSRMGDRPNSTGS